MKRSEMRAHLNDLYQRMAAVALPLDQLDVTFCDWLEAELEDGLLTKFLDEEYQYHKGAE